MNTVRRTQSELFGKLFAVQVVLTGLVVTAVLCSPTGIMLAVAIVVTLLSAVCMATLSARIMIKPLRAVSQAVLHISPSQHGSPAPEIESLTVGRAFVTELVTHIHDLANVPADAALAQHRSEATQAMNILSHLALPLFVFNNEQRVVFASDIAMTYVDSTSPQLLGQPLTDALDMEFSNEFTLEKWIKDCQENKATDTGYWRRVRIRSKNNPEYQKQCDIAGSYSRDNSQGVEFVITMFDHTEEYDQDDQSINFVALAVHELRTPLTVMRGYIEAFQDELDGKLDNSLQVYMDRLQASARQLSAFVNNILNVVRIQENQLAVKLLEEDWSAVLQGAVRDMTLQAKTRGKHLELQVTGDLPTVGVDRNTIYEVLCNLIDNAIKYSGTSETILISSSLTKDGLVETSIQDHGVGIPASVLPTLFEKFHRNHRNKLQISGTGLGLFISKAIVDAHGGNIWVNSQEGEGSTFSFTLSPYASLAANQKTGDNTGMTRTTHGWIKNHNMFRK